MTKTEQTFTIKGYDFLEKNAGPGNKTSVRVNVPLAWQGKKMVVILLEE